MKQRYTVHQRYTSVTPALHQRYTSVKPRVILLYLYYMYKEMREGAQGELILGTIKHNKWDHMVKHLTLSRDTTNLHDN